MFRPTACSSSWAFFWRSPGDEVRLEHRHLDVFAGAERRDQVIELEDEADLPGAVVVQVWHLGEQSAADADRAGRRVFERGDQVQQRRLAAAGGAGDGHELAGRDVEVDAVEGAMTRPSSNSLTRPRTSISGASLIADRLQRREPHGAEGGVQRTDRWRPRRRRSARGRRHRRCTAAAGSPSRSRSA